MVLRCPSVQTQTKLDWIRLDQRPNKEKEAEQGPDQERVNPNRDRTKKTRTEFRPIEFD